MEGKSGSPEKPLSDLGKLSYRSFWSGVLLRILQQTTGAITVKELAQKTGFTEEDIIQTLQVLGLIKVRASRQSQATAHYNVKNLFV